MSVHPAQRCAWLSGRETGCGAELVRYSTVKHIDLVEIDEMVVKVCRKYLPFTACALDDKRVNIHYQDGLNISAGVRINMI